MVTPSSNWSGAGPSRRWVRWRRWLLLEADRRLVAAVPLLLVFGSLVVLGAIDPVPLRRAVEQSDPIETLFQAFVTAIITGVTIVVTINQLVLSQELGAVGDQRDRMEGAMAFRRDVEAALDIPVSPAEPGRFLQALLEGICESGAAVRAASVGTSNHDETEAFVTWLTADADHAATRLADARFGTFDVVSAAMGFDYSRAIHEARTLRSELPGDDGGEMADALSGLLDRLELYGPAREHVKTLYFQWALIDLSRTVLYASVPALIVATGVILFLDDPATVTGTTAGIDNLLWVVSAASTVALTPFAVLLAAVLRIASVAQRTLAIGPFALRRETTHGRE